MLSSIGVAAIQRAHSAPLSAQLSRTSTVVLFNMFHLAFFLLLFLQRLATSRTTRGDQSVLPMIV